MGGKVRIWKQARKLVINSELKSTGEPPHACRRRRPNGRFSHWELMQTSLRFRLSRKPHGRRAKDKEKKEDSETSLSTAAVTKLGTRPAPPPRLKTRSNREPTPTHNSHNTQHTRVKQNTLFFMQKVTQPSQTCSGGRIISNPTQIDASDASFLMGSIN